MANYATLKAAIQQVIKTNGNNEITGALLQQSLLSMINSVAEGYVYKGIAIPSTNPGTPDQNVFYVASQSGVYSNFGGITMVAGEVAILRYNGSWVKDLTGAASAEQIADLYEVIMGYSWQDVTFSTKNQYYIWATAGSNFGSSIYNANTRHNNFIDLTGATRVRISCVAVTGSSTNFGLVFYDATQAPIAGTGYKWVNQPENANVVRELEIPEGAKYVRSTIRNDYTGAFVCQLYKAGTPITERVAQLEQEVSELQRTSSFGEANEAKMMENDVTMPIAVDWMQYVHRVNGMNSVSVLTVVSSTTAAITLSSEDAAHFASASPAVVKYGDGSFKLVYFKAASGTTVERASYESTSLAGAVSVQSLHDTVAGANGQHLSPYGYLGLAHFMVAQLSNNKAFRLRNYVGGCIMASASLTPADGKVYNANGDLVCSPIFHNVYNSGFTPSGNNTAQGYGIRDNTDGAGGAFSKRFYLIQQGVQGGYIEFPIKGTGKGYLRIEAGIRATSVFTGGINVTVFVDGQVFNTFALIPNITEFIVGGINASSSVSVRFTLPDQLDTQCKIYNIAFFRMYDSVPAPAVDHYAKVAFLGDSWTQFPPAGQALPDYQDYNATVVRPDGTLGNGYGYLPKEFARLTGAVVHNWGKSNETSAGWGLPELDKLLDYTHYDYVVIEFFINDLNGSMAFETWKANIKAMCEKCRRAGATPIVIMPCGTNSIGQTFGLGAWHEGIVKGIYEDSAV